MTPEVPFLKEYGTAAPRTSPSSRDSPLGGGTWQEGPEEVSVFILWRGLAPPAGKARVSVPGQGELSQGCGLLLAVCPDSTRRLRNDCLCVF